MIQVFDDYIEYKGERFNIVELEDSVVHIANEDIGYCVEIDQETRNKIDLIINPNTESIKSSVDDVVIESAEINNEEIILDSNIPTEKKSVWTSIKRFFS